MPRRKKKIKDTDLGNLITTGFFSGVSSSFGLFLIIVALESKEKTGLLYPAAIVCLTAGIMCFRLAVVKGKSLL